MWQTLTMLKYETVILPQSDNIMKHTKWTNTLNTGCGVYMETTSTQGKEHGNQISDKTYTYTHSTHV